MFPTLRTIIQEGSALTSAAKYEAWAEKLKKVLRARTLHLHSPTEARRIHLSEEHIATLATLDRADMAAKLKFDDAMKFRAKQKLKPARAAANAVIASNRMKQGVSSAFLKPSQLEELELEKAF